MKFSFVTCTYNRAKYLRQTLDSLVRQEFDKEKYELVVVNNNSSDETLEVCAEFKTEYPKHHISIFTETSQGLSFALNRGIKEARGEFLIYIDDDETIASDYLKNLVSYLTTYPQVELCGSAVIPIYEIAQPKWMSTFTQRLIGGAFMTKARNPVQLKKNSYPGTGHTIIKKELYDRYGFYNTELGRKGSGLMGAEDKDMSFRLIENGVKCYFFPDIPVYHHIPAYKMTDEFFTKLTLSIGKSERIRTKNISTKAFYKRLFSEALKWGASFILCFFYCLTLRTSKGLKLLEFRWNVTKGLLGGV